MRDKMKYDNESAVQEIRKRAAAMKEKQEKRNTVLLASGGVILCILMIGAVIFYAGKGASAGIASGTDYAYGTMFTGGQIGAFVLVGVLAFTTGVIVTAACMNIRRSRDKLDTESE